MTDYATLHSASISNPTDFWAKAAEGIEWAQRWDNVLEQKDSTTYRWFSGGKLNTCFNALDRHVQGGRANQAAIIYDSPVTDSQRKISYAELLSEVELFAGVLAANGASKGDRVIIYMPISLRQSSPFSLAPGWAWCIR